MLKFITTLSLLIVIYPLFAQEFSHCGQEELHNRMMQRPEYKEKQKKIEQHYLNVMNNLEDYKSKSSVATYTIPVVFHVMHNPNLSIGQGSNISLSRIQTEIDNWNLAFNNTGAYAGGPFHCNAGVNSTSVDINFCLATQDPLGFPTTGVERYSFQNGNPLFKEDSSPNTGFVDLDMKELSNWDSEKYLNVWVVDKICFSSSNPNSCGVIGYATLPGSSGMIDDGVVVEDAYVGTNANSSKVMVHELGHYFNLYHTFQGGCSSQSCLTSGDLVCDTPLDNTTSYTSCASNQTINSCTNDASVPNSPFQSDVQDMYENYMDYSQLSCMNTFTPNQATRMEAVLMSGGGREELTTSTGCDSPSVTNTQVAFSTTQLSVSEGAADTEDNCEEYSTFKLKVKISQLPTSSVTLDFSTSGSATSGRDFELVTNSVIFKTTGSLYKYVDIRIYDDAIIEGLETIVLSYTISGPAIGASSNQSLTLNLKDNDVMPGEEFLSEDFESGASGWLSSGFGPPQNPFVFGSNSDLTGLAAYISTNTTTMPFNYNNSIQDNPLLVSPIINGEGINGAKLTFDYQANGSGDDYGRLAYTLGPNYNFYEIFGPVFTNQGSSVKNADIEIPAILDNESFKLGFIWVNNGNGTGNNPPFAIDNVKILHPFREVGSNLNVQAEEYLGPNETVYFFSDNNEFLAKIKNTSEHDYGCTTITIDRSGTGATNGTGDYESFQFLDKTISVSPTNNNSSGTYEITLYYTENEIAGWESETGLSRSDLSMIKTTGSISNAESSNSEVVGFTQSSYGEGDWAYKANFSSGFSGFGFSVISLPLELVSFQAIFVDENIKLDWMTINEVLMDKIVIERSSDGVLFEAFDSVQPKGKIRNEYELVDYMPNKGKNYYRLKLVSLDGSYTYSKVVSLRAKTKFDVTVYPNPISEEVLQLQLFSEFSQDFSYVIYNIEGLQVMGNDISNKDILGRIEIPFRNQKPGLYYIKVIQGDQIKVVRFFKH